MRFRNGSFPSTSYHIGLHGVRTTAQEAVTLYSKERQLPSQVYSYVSSTSLRRKIVRPPPALVPRAKTSQTGLIMPGRSRVAFSAQPKAGGILIHSRPPTCGQGEVPKSYADIYDEDDDDGSASDDSDLQGDMEFPSFAASALREMSAISREYLIQKQADRASDMIKAVRAVPAEFIGAQCTVEFPYPGYMVLQRPTHSEHGANPMRTFPVDGTLRFQIHSDVPDYYVVSRVLLAAGLRPTKSTARCNLFWGKTLRPEQWELLTNLQRVNHFPGSTALARKDKLAISLREASNCNHFCPETYVLPGDRLAFQAATLLPCNQDAIWIQKPPASSCGRGIRLIDRFGQIGARSKTVVSRYIERPFLIDGFKFDIRLYFVVTCIDPLRIYTLDDGLVRFATRKYSLERSSFKQKCVHLTNFSVNRHSKTFVKATENDMGSKWSFKALLKHLSSLEPPVDVVELQRRINDIAVHSIITVEPMIHRKMDRYRCPRLGCFEVFGFDILIDQDLTPWLLEINAMPSLSSSSHLDKFIKTKLIADVFHLIGVSTAENDIKVIRRAQTRRLKRVIGLTKSNIKTPRPGSAPVHNLVSAANITPQDKAILREVESENRRRGHLQRIFPSPDTIDTYLPMFQYERHNNLLVANWMKLGADEARAVLQSSQ